jgi:hypothetical protein
MTGAPNIPTPNVPVLRPDGGMDQRWYEPLKKGFTDLLRLTTSFGNAQGLLGTAAFKNIGTSGGTVPLLNTANQWAKQQWSPIKTLTEAEIVAGFDLDENQTAIVTLTDDRVLGDLTNAKPGATYQLAVMASAFALTYGSMYKFPGGTVPTSSGDCLISMFCPSEGVLWCVMAKEFS